ncbi:EAL domain-containing protein [Hoeflea prorocentri]|uniref:EAL domain-containing protein n=1 Tax=Hoeflea prorocentri TaxID=1922333 RepID=A0A9X3UDU1_9HYPH|nr:EAL domain-containing protein [Hoeflea prorocentri]MCY6379578.1 EAL domain-containing protein [Hoeflea prorocentri]MDA5397378.1 EAL domain-containing protein [Hoeflea prorocentri]
MTETSANGRILSEPDGSSTASFGPFVMKTALQPIIGRNRSGALVLRGLEGLLRLFFNGRPFSPADFFTRIGDSERINVDALCRRIHLANASLDPLKDILLFLNFDPGVYNDHRQIALEVARLKKDAATGSFPPRHIVCEMTERHAAAPNRLHYLTECLREHGFKIAVDDFGAKSSDAQRVKLLSPDIVKLDSAWVQRLMASQSGFSALKDAINRFRQDGALVVVEGMEENFQVELAWGAGADFVQGFALARPQLAPTRFSGIFRHDAA